MDLLTLWISGWRATGSSYTMSRLIRRTLKLRRRGEAPYEAYLSAEPPQARQDPRFPQENENRGGQAGDSLSQATGPQETHRLVLGLRKGMRLTDSPEFERVYKRGTAYRGKLISVHAFPRGAGGPRLGLSVSKKVGNAVSRNSVKRRLRELFRSRFPGSEPELDFVVSARPAASGATYAELERELDRALERLGSGS